MPRKRVPSKNSIIGKTPKKPKSVPKKRVVKTKVKISKKKTSPTKKGVEPKIVKIAPSKTNKHSKRSVNPTDYIRVRSGAKQSKFVELGNKVLKGELKWLYYKIDNGVAYHYYLKINS